MKSQILGSDDLLRKAKDATPQDKNIYINWEALQELPEQFEAVISAVKFDKDLSKNFTDVGSGNWMPKTELMYQIAEAKGVSGGDNSITEAVYETVDINPMLCKPMEDEPTYRKIKVGEKVVKFSTVIEEDGTLRRSSPCTQIFNVWDRCNEAWSKEEKYTKGYTVKGRYDNKYQTKFDRKAHFDGEMKFAFAKAETKAYTKTIRELAGLMTGYTAQDLKSGELLFAKIRKSSKALQLEQAANLERISNGGKKQNILFGEPEKNVTEKITQTDVGGRETEVPHVNGELTVTPVEEAIAEIECGCNTPFVSGDLKTKLENIVKWLKEQPTADQSPHWGDIQKTIGEMRDLIDA